LSCLGAQECENSAGSHRLGGSQGLFG